jgi:ADP-heptose:LPS heptosyltransferase
MPRVVLTRALTYRHEGVSFRRGLPQTVDEGTYNFLLRQGHFRDPDQDIDFITPVRLRGVAGQTEIPIIRDVGMGDVLMVAIPLRELAKRYPSLKLVYAVSAPYVPMFRDCSFLSRVMAISEMHGQWPYGIDLRGYGERAPGAGRDNRIELYMRYLLGHTQIADIDFPLYPRPEEAARGRLLARAGDKPILLHAVQASVGNRSWPWEHVETLAEIARDAGWQTVLVHSGPVATTARLSATGATNLCGQTPVPDLMCLVAAADVVVAPDTGVTHLAEAMKTKCVTYFTTVPPIQRLKHYRYTRALWARELDCLGCIHTPTCGMPDPKPCARALTPEDVWAEVMYVHRNSPPWPLEADRNFARPGPNRSRWLPIAGPRVGVAA